jgi:hypothetical protein
LARPIYGQGFFHVSREAIFYTIVFDYADEEMEYQRLLSGPPEALRAEEERLRSEMQSLMDSERVIINGERVRPRVIAARAEVRGEPRRSTATFLVEMPWRPRTGVNVYEDFYEPDVAEYDYVVYWLMPPCASIRSYEMPGRVRIEGRLLEVRVRAGTRVEGYESIAFELPEGCLTAT